MTNLTEKYKKRELKEGAYYVRNEHDVIFTAENYINYDCFNDTKTCDFYNVETNIVEVLAPVPSYAEWQKYVEANEGMFSVVKMLNKDNYKLENENQRLKKLLKKVRCYLLDDYDIEDRILLCETIDEVLNDNE